LRRERDRESPEVEWKVSDEHGTRADTTTKKAKANANGKANGRLMELRLYVAGQTQISGGIGELEENLLGTPGRAIQTVVIDLMKRPAIGAK